MNKSIIIKIPVGMKKQKRSHKILIFGLLFLLFSGRQNFLLAQLTDTTRLLVEEGSVERMNNNISVKLSFNNDYEIFKVLTETNDVVLHPNINTVSQFKVNYRFISFGFKMAPDFLPGNGDDDIKGKTKSFGLGTSLVFRHWFFNIAYSRTNGFYLKNTADFIPWEKGDPYIQMSDLDYKSFSFGTGYSLNPKFSVMSITTQTERQLKSAGSFVPVFNFRYYTMDDKTEMVGTAKQSSNNFELTIGAGYHYNFVAKEKFYVSLGFTPGFGFINTKLKIVDQTGTSEVSGNTVAFRWDGRGGLGYNGRDFFTGCYVNVMGVYYRQENTTAINHDTRVFYQLFVGMRMKAPGGLKRFLDRLERKLKNLNRK